MIILGINAFHGDSSACLVMDGVLVAAAEEERFRRVKHWAGFPTEAIRYCLDAGGVGVTELDRIAVNRNPGSNAMRKALYAFAKKPSLKSVSDRLKNASKIRNIRDEIAASFEISPKSVSAKIDNVEHHMAHLSSAFFVSPFNDAAVVSVDGFGDFASTIWGVGHNNTIIDAERIYFPHSLGLFYLAITQYLGFPNYGDEYKVMGLAPYGKPIYLDRMRKIVHLRSSGQFELNLDFFVHQSEGVSMVWDQGAPQIGKVFSSALESVFGPSRDTASDIEQYHSDIAASAQLMYEEAFFHLLNFVRQDTGASALALAGGCAMNSVANGKIFDQTGFNDVYIQSAAGDAGGAIGAAFFVWNQTLGNPRSFEMTHAYWGPEYSDKQNLRVIENYGGQLERLKCVVKLLDSEAELCEYTANSISRGNVIGWFQGRMEFGPRALGNRSILGDPRRKDMKSILNLKIKRRESFRPFAPSILREHTSNWFEVDSEVPFMLQVFPVLKHRRNQIPAVTHVNGSGRLQTVNFEQNPRYYRLIESFRGITGVPILLNTSFNENEPVVCLPEEAMECFLRTKMDVLVLGNFIIERQSM